IGAKHELVEAFIRGANDIGIPRRVDFNTGDNEGVGYYQLTTRHGWRCSTAVAYLKPARGRRNLTVETDAQVTGVRLDGPRATGVTYERHGATIEVAAGREVLLSAGALQSPQLLQLSGIGPAALLAKRGVPVTVDLPGVGSNLQDHLQLR